MDPVIGLGLAFIGGKFLIGQLQKIRQNYIDNHYVPPANTTQRNPVPPAPTNIQATPGPEPYVQQPDVPRIGYHGTDSYAAYDIFQNNRFIPGIQNSLWIAETINDAKHYVTSKDGQDGLIVAFIIDLQNNCLKIASETDRYWIITAPNPEPNTHYSMPGVYPSALLDINGNQIVPK